MRLDIQVKLSRPNELDWLSHLMGLDGWDAKLSDDCICLYIMWSNSGVQEMWPLAFCMPMNRRGMVAKPRIWAQGMSVLSCLRTINQKGMISQTKPWTWIHGITVLSYHSTIIYVDHWISNLELLPWTWVHGMRCSFGLHLMQKIIFLPWWSFEPRTSWMTVKQANHYMLPCIRYLKPPWKLCVKTGKNKYNSI